MGQNACILERKYYLSSDGYALGGGNSRLRPGAQHLPVYAQQWIRKMEEQKIKHRYVYAKGTALNHPLWKNRIVPKEYVTPVATQIFGDRVLISIWEPTLVAILIQSEEVADAYKRHFSLLWSIGKEEK